MLGEFYPFKLIIMLIQDLSRKYPTILNILRTGSTAMM